MKKKDLSKGEMALVKQLVMVDEANVTDLGKATKKNRTFVSRVINKLLSAKVVEVRQEGNKRFYRASLEAKIAFGNNQKGV